MTGMPDLHDFSPDDRATAMALRESFAALTLERAMPTGTKAPLLTPVTAAGGSARRGLTDRAKWSLAAAAAAAAVVAGASLLVPAATSPAWASIPAAATPDDVAEASAVCGANLGGGLGTLEGSGSVAAPAAGSTSTGTFEGSTAGAAPGGAAADVTAPTPPTTLPPLQALDIRGTGALAVYGNDDWHISCLLYQDGGTWVSGGLTVTEGGAAPDLTASGGTVRADGQTVSTVEGAAAPGATDVTITLASGTTAEATVANGRYVAWFPEQIGADTPTVRQFDARGAALPVG